MALSEQRKKELRNKYGKDSFSNFKTSKSEFTPTPRTSTVKEKGEKGVKGLLTGALKRFGGDAKFSSELVAKADPITKFLPSSSNIKNVVNVAKQIPSMFSKVEKSRGMSEGELTTPQGRTEEMGALGFDIATILAPSKSVFKGTAKAIERGAQKSLLKQLETITQKIAPKLSKGERMAAISEGRVTETGGKLFGRIDEVQATKKIEDAAKTVFKRIPDAAKKSTFEIANYARKEISSIAKRLEKNLKQVKLPEQEVTETLDKWDALKTAQHNLPEWDISPGVSAKDQQVFEKYLEKLINADDLDGVWKIVQEYDDTVRTSIKNATNQSSDLAQFRSDTWRQNRTLLRDIVDRMAENLVPDSKKSFKEMTDLYTVRNNIINNAEVFTKRKGGIFNPSDFAKKVIGGTVIGTGAAGILGSFFE